MAALRLIGAGLLVVAVAAGLWKAYALGGDAERARSAMVLEQWRASIERQAAERRQAQQARYRQLQEEFDELRQRPERVRTVVRRIEVRPDDICGSLPGDWRRLWNAAYDSGVRVGTATEAARLDDAGRVALADAAESIRIARERFETNAARLSALQSYVRAISPKE